MSVDRNSSDKPCKIIGLKEIYSYWVSRTYRRCKQDLFHILFLNGQYCLWLTDVHAISKDLRVYLCEFVGTCIQVPDARSPAARDRLFRKSISVSAGNPVQEQLSPNWAITKVLHNTCKIFPLRCWLNLYTLPIEFWENDNSMLWRHFGITENVHLGQTD